MEFQEIHLCIVEGTPPKMFDWAILRKFGGPKLEQFSLHVTDKNPIKWESVGLVEVHDHIITTKRKVGATQEETEVKEEEIEDVALKDQATAVAATTEALMEVADPQEEAKVVEWKRDIELFLTAAQEQKLSGSENLTNDFMRI